jgi:PHS family inorganic phosphate transporter-like MFS transporter
MIIGDIGFGYLSDVLGRKKMYGSELLIIVGSTIVSCLSADTPSGMTVCGMFIFWRFILGIGIGGDYPVSAIMTSEFASSKNRG